MNPVTRLASMKRDELRFRLTCEIRKAIARAQWAAGPARWDRTDLTRILSPANKFDSSSLAQARSAADRGNWLAAHRALSSHFAKQPSIVPLESRAIGRLADRIRARFPAAPAESAARADRLLEGRYDLLGYRALPFGHPPRWDYDPVSNRVAPGGFWSSVMYLDPASGDHKVIWELNRHQHWLALGRAYHLTGDLRYYDEFVSQLESWVAANPPLTGVNWASMLELAFRSLSWIWALHLFAGVAAGSEEAVEPPAGPEPWAVDLLVGLDRQLTHIEHNLSRYFSPNTHLTGEALALYVSGAALPELAASRRRMTAGRDVLLGEIDRQILADGGHAERSAHYHRYSTDFYLLAVLAARGSQDGEAARFEEAALRQARYLRTIADGAGRLALIGDDDGGQLFPMCGRDPADCRDTLANAAAILGVPELAIGEIPEETFWLCGSTLPVEQLEAGSAGPASTALPSSGYYISRDDGGNHLIFDAGPHGFLNGGHAHSDALSVVLTVAGRPFLVDPGTGTYTMDPSVRDLFRSTAMHNTVVMNGRPQSAPFGPFHWRSTAQAQATTWRSAERADYAEGRHDGYAPQVHARGVLAMHGFGWFVVDHFLGVGASSADAYWHLHPAWNVVASERACVRLEHADGAVLQLAASADLDVLNGADGDTLGAFAGTYGRIEPAVCLRCRTNGPHPRSVLTFVPAAGLGGHTISIQPLPSGMSHASWHGAAFRVRLDEVEVVFMAAIEASGPAQTPDAAPPGVWGPDAAKTDARIAVLVARGGLPAEGLLVNGRQLVAPGFTVNMAEASALRRFTTQHGMAHP